MDYQNLREQIVEVIRQNGNEEITGDVLQYVLLEMVTALGEGYRFLGVATPETQPAATDGDAFYVGVKGEYRNFPGISVDIDDGVLAFFFFTDGTWSERGVRITQPIDSELTPDGENPVAGGAIYAEFEKLRAAGYLFGGVATPSNSPAQGVTEKVFYIATAAGEYPNYAVGITLQSGLNFLLFDGTTWSVVTPVLFVNEVTENSQQLVTSGAVYTAVGNKVDKVPGKGLSTEDFTTLEKAKLGNLPTAAQLAEILALKQNVLTFDAVPTQGSENPVYSGGVYNAIKDLDPKIADVTIETSTKVVNVGVFAEVAVVIRSTIEGNIVLKRNGSVLSEMTGQALSFTDSLNEASSGTVVYQAEVTIRGQKITVTADVVVANPVVYGMAAQISDVTTKASPRMTPEGRYNMVASVDESKIFILVPMSMTVQYVTMSGIEVPMEAPTGVVVGDVAYKCYASSNTYDAGNYTINVY